MVDRVEVKPFQRIRAADPLAIGVRMSSLARSDVQAAGR
jgi:hypothetical protein